MVYKFSFRKALSGEIGLFHPGIDTLDTITDEAFDIDEFLSCLTKHMTS